MIFKEVVELPSQGILYSNKISKIELGLITTEQEKILYGSTSPYVIDELLTACILTPEVKVDELLVADKMFILYQLRALSYDDEYNYMTSCPNCKKSYKASLKISELPISTLATTFTEPIEVTLAAAKIKVGLRLPRGKDEKFVVERVKQLSKVINISNTKGLEYAITLARCVLTIDGKDVNVLEAETLINGLLAKDTARIRKAIEAVKCGYDTQITETCPHCRGESTYELPIGKEFFRPE